MFVLLLFKTVNGQRQNTVSNHKETLSGNVPVKKKKHDNNEPEFIY